eukprot:6185206-Pleurochrysis_carterae.AAC.2
MLHVDLVSTSLIVDVAGRATTSGSASPPTTNSTRRRDCHIFNSFGLPVSSELNATLLALLVSKCAFLLKWYPMHRFVLPVRRECHLLRRWHFLFLTASVVDLILLPDLLMPSTIFCTLHAYVSSILQVLRAGPIWVHFGFRQLQRLRLQYDPSEPGESRQRSMNGRAGRERYPAAIVLKHGEQFKWAHSARSGGSYSRWGLLLERIAERAPTLPSVPRALASARSQRASARSLLFT